MSHLVPVFAISSFLLIDLSLFVLLIQELNESGNIDDDTVILSADVVALYPSLNIEFTTDKVCEMFHESKVEVKGVDYEEVGLYLSLTKTSEDIERLGLQD